MKNTKFTKLPKVTNLFFVILYSDKTDILWGHILMELKFLSTNHLWSHLIYVELISYEGTWLTSTWYEGHIEWSQIRKYCVGYFFVPCHVR